MSISLIIPCFNEETNIQKGVLDKFGNYTKHDDRFKEVLIVDDGSTDQSKNIIKECYLTEFPKFKLIENTHQGKAFTIITGIRQAQMPYVMFSDMDLATPIEEAEKLIQQVHDGYEIVIGSRNTQRRGAPLIRKIQSLGFIYIRNFLIGLKGIRDTQCGFKLFEREKALFILQRLVIFKHAHTIHDSSVSAAFDLEFLFLANKFGYKIKEVPVEWRHVETKNVSFLRDAIETLRDIVKIKYYDLHKKYEA